MRHVDADADGNERPMQMCGRCRWNVLIQAPLAHVIAALDATSFRDEGDRLITKCIVHAFLLKRVLLDAVMERRLETVAEILDELKDVGMLKTTLDQPVNAKWDTLLHVAVDIGSPELVKLLMSRGASRRLR